MREESLKLLVTGGNGFVAGSVIQQAPADWEVHVLSRTATVTPRVDHRFHGFDPKDSGSLANVFMKVRPHVLIHTAALADIDYCEAHPAKAQAVNIELVRVLARLCAQHRTRLIFCSTDTIFDGEHAPYGEEALPGPVNCYARTKVEAEGIVRTLEPQSVIARLSLVMGLPLLGAGNSFLPKMLAALRAGRPVEVPAREVRTPIDVITAGRALLELAVHDFSGTIHLAGSSSLNRFEMATHIAVHFNLPPELIVPTDPAKIAARAPRPRDVSLKNVRAATLLRTPMLGLEAALNFITQMETSRHHENTPNQV
jgi:dTDP-4-dehydrorhamnose reductase